MLMMITIRTLISMNLKHTMHNKHLHSEKKIKDENTIKTTMLPSYSIG